MLNLASDRVSVILPTYNEAENISILIPEIAKVLANIGSFEIIVVDDNSTDGTGEVAKKLSAKYPIKLITRPGKMGLTSAIHTGILHAEGDVIIVMDADLQHPPSTILHLLKRARDCDIVIASRYVEGGKVIGFPLIRRITSIGAILLSRLLIKQARGIKDPVSGFFLVKKKIVEQWKPVEPRGYKALVEILTFANKAVICEEPYEFKSRSKGTSKLDSKTILYFARLIFKLNPLGMIFLVAISLAILVYIVLAFI